MVLKEQYQIRALTGAKFWLWQFEHSKWLKPDPTVTKGARFRNYEAVLELGHNPICAWLLFWPKLLYIASLLIYLVFTS